MPTLAGSCHCGAVRVEFETAKHPDAIRPRACQCSFCRRHGAKTVSDPDGKLVLYAAPDALTPYRFATGTLDILLCRTCGSFVAATMENEHGRFGVLNVVGSRIAELSEREAAPASYEALSAEQRVAGRVGRWTPMEIRSS
ncbi:MAG: aldehyde-activating protein [Alphaproteobacteria bacterium]